MEYARSSRIREAFAARFRSIEENVEKVVQGQASEIRLALVALIAEGTC